jgi:hypothetical protein
MEPPDTTTDLSPNGAESGADGPEMEQIWSRIEPLLVKEKDIGPWLSMSASTLRRFRDKDEFPGNQARQLGGTWYYAIELLREAIREYWETTRSV